MITDKFTAQMHQKIRAFTQWLRHYTNRLWYPPFIGLLALLDNIVIVIPNDGILISSSMLFPKRWWFLALMVAIGSTLGAIGLASLVEWKGMAWILEIYPGINESKSWLWSLDFFDRYGLLLVFVVAVTPLMQQPAVILAGLANTPLWKLAAVIFAGRFIKYLVMAYIASHTPRLLKKIWGVRGELEDAGVEIKD